MEEFLTLRVLTVAAIIFALLMAVFLSLVAGTVKKVDGKLSALGGNIDRIMNERFSDLADTLRTEIEERQQDMQLRVDKLGDSWRGSLDKTVTDVQGSIGELQTGLEERSEQDRKNMAGIFGEHAAEVNEQLGRLHDTQAQEMTGFHKQLSEQTREHARTEHTILTEGLEKLSSNISENLTGLTAQVDDKLVKVNTQFDSRLQENMSGLLKVFSTFANKVDVIEATRSQIENMAQGVEQLKRILDDRRSRGTIGEVLVESIVSDVLSPNDYELNASLSNGEKVNCLLKLPKPSGNVAISSHFDLSDLEVLTGTYSSEQEIDAARKSFATKLENEIKQVSERCIIPGETAEGAVLLLASETAFIEAHSNHRELIAEAYQRQVWIASPTTVIAMVTVARAVIKDATARHEIQRIHSKMTAIEADFEGLEQSLSTFYRNFDQLLDTSIEIRKTARVIGDRFHSVSRLITEDPAAAPSEDLPSDSPPKQN